MDNDLVKVIDHVSEYFKTHLPQYAILEIRRMSFHPDDDYLYMVSARKDDGTYAVWTNWNEDLKTLNHGHYDLSSAEDCLRIFAEHCRTNKKKLAETYKAGLPDLQECGQ